MKGVKGVKGLEGVQGLKRIKGLMGVKEVKPFHICTESYTGVEIILRGPLVDYFSFSPDVSKKLKNDKTFRATTLLTSLC